MIMQEKIKYKMIQDLVNTIGKVSSVHDDEILLVLQKYTDNRNCFEMSERTATLIKKTINKFNGKS